VRGFQCKGQVFLLLALRANAHHCFDLLMHAA